MNSFHNEISEKIINSKIDETFEVDKIIEKTMTNLIEKEKESNTKILHEEISFLEQTMKVFVQDQLTQLQIDLKAGLYDDARLSSRSKMSQTHCPAPVLMNTKTPAASNKGVLDSFRRENQNKINKSDESNSNLANKSQVRMTPTVLPNHQKIQQELKLQNNSNLNRKDVSNKTNKQKLM